MSDIGHQSAGPSAAPRATVVIPVFNCERFIGDAIESALGQSEPAPVLVVNDGSTDSTAAVLRKFASRIDVLTKTNGGTSSAWNVALENVTSEFVVGLDADDLLEREAVTLLVETARRHVDAAVVYSDYRFVDEWNRSGQQVANPEANDPVRQLLVLHDRLGEKDNFVPFGHARLYRRQALIDAGGYDESYLYAEDYELLLRMAQLGSQFVRCPAQLYRYRWHDSNKGVVARPEQISEVRRAVRELDSSLRNKEQGKCSELDS